MVEFRPDNARMVPASEKLYELIVERRLVHDWATRCCAPMCSTRLRR